MLRLAEVLDKHRISRRALARGAGWSEAGLGRLIRRGEYPARALPERTRQRVIDALRKQGVSDEAMLATAFDEIQVAVARSNEPLPDAVLGQQPEQPQEVVMLIRKQCVSPAAREFFGLRMETLTAPWKRDQVFLGGEMRVSYEHMLAKAMFGGVLAIAGESGAGKSTLKDLLVTDLQEAGEVVVIEPHTQAMEGNDKAGKTLKTSHICEAILREVAPTVRMKISMEAQLNQVARALVASLAENKERRHLLVIDEAHALPIPTLRHLKRFMEMKDPQKRGLQRPLLGIVLLGHAHQPGRRRQFDQCPGQGAQRGARRHCRCRCAPGGRDTDA